jgi:hypothetical protein
VVWSGESVERRSEDSAVRIRLTRGFRSAGGGLVRRFRGVACCVCRGLFEKGFLELAVATRVDVGGAW